MAVITIGNPAIDRSSYLSQVRTIAMHDNPADGTGAIDTAKLWAVTDMENTEVGTFEDTGANWLRCHDSEPIGLVTAGSEQTFSGLDIDVVLGYYIGCYWTQGQIEHAVSGGAGVWSYSGEAIDPGDTVLYTHSGGRISSLGGTGETPAPPAAKHTPHCGPRKKRVDFFPTLGM